MWGVAIQTSSLPTLHLSLVPNGVAAHEQRRNVRFFHFFLGTGPAPNAAANPAATGAFDGLARLERPLVAPFDGADGPRAHAVCPPESGHSDGVAHHITSQLSQ